MSKIVSIGTAVPAYCHPQEDILHFMQRIYCPNEAEKRKLKFIYHQSAIQQRYSVLPDYGREVQEWKFYPHTENLEPFPTLEQRMAIFNRQAPLLSVDAIRNCLNGFAHDKEITHLITVSCTGMSAPGLDLQVLDLMDLDKTIARTSINFMGCYAAVHALKMADAFCTADQNAKVVIVCTELCTLHFQREHTMDNIASSLLFGDGAAAVLVTGDGDKAHGWHLQNFYSEVIAKGKRDMAWELSSTGFLMTLSSYVPDLIEEDFASVVERALQKSNLKQEDITTWCVHAGGKRILQAVEHALHLDKNQLNASYEVLKQYGNMSSATILFVLKELMKENAGSKKIFGTAFGPGLTVETFTATAV